ncbi:hypothetical protein [Actinoplanes sp. M2I2]|nr:hypothetical protein [Actinoplanes sp. M2I2]
MSTNVPARHRKSRFDYTLFVMVMSSSGLFFVAGFLTAIYR